MLCFLFLALGHCAASKHGFLLVDYQFPHLQNGAAGAWIRSVNAWSTLYSSIALCYTCYFFSHCYEISLNQRIPLCGVLLGQRHNQTQVLMTGNWAAHAGCVYLMEEKDSLQKIRMPPPPPPRLLTPTTYQPIFVATLPGGSNHNKRSKVVSCLLSPNCVRQAWQNVQADQR